MKKLIYLFLALFVFSCSNDDDYKKEMEFTIECLVNNDTIPVNIGGIGFPGGGKYIKKYHKETVRFENRDNFSFRATCEDPTTLITLKLYDRRNKLIREKSGNNVVRIEVGTR